MLRKRASWSATRSGELPYIGVSEIESRNRRGKPKSIGSICNPAAHTLPADPPHSFEFRKYSASRVVDCLSMQVKKSVRCFRARHRGNSLECA